MNSSITSVDSTLNHQLFSERIHHSYVFPNRSEPQYKSTRRLSPLRLAATTLAFATTEIFLSLLASHNLILRWRMDLVSITTSRLIIFSCFLNFLGLGFPSMALCIKRCKKSWLHGSGLHDSIAFCFIAKHWRMMCNRCIRLGAQTLTALRMGKVLDLDKHCMLYVI